MRKNLLGIIALICSVIVGLLFAESILRLFSFDWGFIERLLYYQNDNLQNHISDPDPQVMYRLKAGSKTDSISVNSFGARGNHRVAEKQEGIFRIICVGGSNVFGASLEDNQTWPVRLEEALKNNCPDKFEVWNFGTSAYVPSQMAVMAKEAVKKYNPDLLIFALSNKGWRAFLTGDDIRSKFKENPILWNYYFDRKFLVFPSWLPYKTNIALIRNSSFYRLALFSYMVNVLETRPVSDKSHEDKNIKAAREFFSHALGKTKVIIFVGPAFKKRDFAEYWEGFDLPVMALKAKGMPPEYKENHPPVHVMKWYGEKVKQWLVDGGHIPVCP